MKSLHQEMSQPNKKVIYKVQLQSERAKQKAMKAVSGLPGVDSISMDMKAQRVTVIGKFDRFEVDKKLRKLCHVDILTIGPAEESGKKKEDPKKDDVAKLEKEEPKKGDVRKLANAYQAYNPYMNQDYNVGSSEKDLDACVIC